MGEFKIDTAKDGDVFICRTKGYLDDLSGKKLKELCEGLIATGTNLFIFNLQETPVINSTGLSMLLDLVVNIIDYNDGKVGVVGLTNLTKNALRMTGVLTLCQDFPTEAEALTALKG
jgi:anti-anti-sigma factor